MGKYSPDAYKLGILADELRQIYNRGAPLDLCKEFACAVKCAFENVRDWPGYQMFCLQAGLYDERETDEHEEDAAGAITGPEVASG